MQRIKRAPLAAWPVVMVFGAILVAPLLAGCGGSDSDKVKPTSSEYYNGPMESKSERQKHRPPGTAGGTTTPPATPGRPGGTVP
jgi:hypothetical protein